MKPAQVLLYAVGEPAEEPIKPAASEFRRPHRQFLLPGLWNSEAGSRSEQFERLALWRPTCARWLPGLQALRSPAVCICSCSSFTPVSCDAIALLSYAPFALMLFFLYHNFIRTYFHFFCWTNGHSKGDLRPRSTGQNEPPCSGDQSTRIRRLSRSKESLFIKSKVKGRSIFPGGQLPVRTRRNKKKQANARFRQANCAIKR